jgi:hypothetical protein
LAPHNPLDHAAFASRIAPPEQDDNLEFLVYYSMLQLDELRLPSFP